jgi:hypothetical protein
MYVSVSRSAFCHIDKSTSTYIHVIRISLGFPSWYNLKMLYCFTLTPIDKCRPLSWLPWALVLSLVVGTVSGGIPRPEEFFERQRVDHLSVSDDDPYYWSQRYYSYDTCSQGPGHPIFLIGNILSLCRQSSYR